MLISGRADVAKLAVSMGRHEFMRKPADLDILLSCIAARVHHGEHRL